MLPPDLAVWQVIALVFTSVGTSFLTAAAGIGGGVVLIAVLAAILPPTVLIPVHGVVQIGSNGGRAVMMARYVVPRLLLPFIIGSVIGAAIGGLIVVELPPALLQLGLGGFILFSIWGKVPRIEGDYALTLGGVVSTFLTMFFGATGPFVAGMLKTLKLERMAHSATMAFFMTAQHSLKVLAFGFLGFAFGPYLGLIAMMIAAGLIGTWLGKRFLLSIDDRRFHLALNAVLGLLALQLLWRGVTTLFA